MTMSEQERRERRALMDGVEAEQKAAKAEAVEALRRASMALEDMARAMLLTEFREWRNHERAQTAIGMSAKIDLMVEALSQPPA